MPRTAPQPPAPTGPAYPRVTPRRSIVMDDEMWDNLSELAKQRGLNPSALLRQIAAVEIRTARAAGDLPMPKKRKA